MPHPASLNGPVVDMLLPLHGLGGAKDLPIPLELAIATGTAALIVSFCVLALAWRSPRYQGPRPGRPVPGVERVVDDPRFQWTLRIIGLAFAIYLLWALIWGPDLVTNPVLGTFYVLVWVGLVPASLLFGPVVKAFSPVRTLNLLLAKVTGGDAATGLMKYPAEARVLARGRRAVRLRLAGAGQPAERLPEHGAALAGRLSGDHADRRRRLR